MLYEDSLGADFQPALDALLESIEEPQGQAIRTALNQVIARLIEGRLLSDTVLTERLKGLEEQGLAARELGVGEPPRVRYFLTERGQSLRPVLEALYAWGE